MSFAVDDGHFETVWAGVGHVLPCIVISCALSLAVSCALRLGVGAVWALVSVLFDIGLVTPRRAALLRAVACM